MGPEYTHKPRLLVEADVADLELSFYLLDHGGNVCRRSASGWASAPTQVDDRLRWGSLRLGKRGVAESRSRGPWVTWFLGVCRTNRLVPLPRARDEFHHNERAPDALSASAYMS